MANVITFRTEFPEALEDALDSMAMAKMELEAMAEAHADDPDLLDMLYRADMRLRNAARLAVHDYGRGDEGIGARLLNPLKVA